MKQFAELPDWTFDADEVSAGVYRAFGRDQDGRKVEATGLDPDALIEKCKQSAIQIMAERRPSTEVNDQCDYSGMTVNERLSRCWTFVGVGHGFRISRNRERMIVLLSRVGLKEQAEQIVNTVLANPERYGF